MTVPITTTTTTTIPKSTPAKDVLDIFGLDAVYHTSYGSPQQSHVGSRTKHDVVIKTRFGGSVDILLEGDHCPEQGKIRVYDYVEVYQPQ